MNAVEVPTHGDELYIVCQGNALACLELCMVMLACNVTRTRMRMPDENEAPSKRETTLKMAEEEALVWCLLFIRCQQRQRRGN